jgi:Stage II sporulation protein E (SpoIIE)/GAF domain
VQLVQEQGTSRFAPQVLDEAERQRALDALGVLDTAPEERFDRVTRLAQRLFGVSTAAVTLIDRDRQWYKSRQGVEEMEHARAGTLCNLAIRQPDTLVVEDAREDERFHDNPFVTGAPHLRFYAGHPLLAPGGQPVGTFCVYDTRPRRFGTAERELLRDLAVYVQQELTLGQELDRAAEVQRALLPRSAPSLPGYDLAGACLPSRAVGGDLLDWYPIQDGMALTVADVMGKGIGAAIMMATVRAVLRGAARRGNAGRALTRAAAALESDLEDTSTLVTAFHARLHAKDGRVTYADAGHGLAIVVGADGEVRQLASDELPFGVLPEQEWQERTTTLEPGDTLVAFSDGLLDVCGGTLAAIDEVAAFAVGAESAAEVIERVDAVARAAGALDDVTIMVARRVGS